NRRLTIINRNNFNRKLILQIGITIDVELFNFQIGMLNGITQNNRKNGLFELVSCKFIIISIGLISISNHYGSRYGCVINLIEIIKNLGNIRLSLIKRQRI